MPPEVYESIRQVMISRVIYPCCYFVPITQYASQDIPLRFRTNSLKTAHDSQPTSETAIPGAKNRDLRSSHNNIPQSRKKRIREKNTRGSRVRTLQVESHHSSSLSEENRVLRAIYYTPPGNASTFSKAAELIPEMRPKEESVIVISEVLENLSGI